MVVVSVNKDGTVRPIKRHTIFDYANGEKARDSLLSQLSGWSGFFCKYSDVVADSAISRAMTPYTKGILYLSSVVALVELVRHIGITWEQTRDLHQDYTIEKKETFCFELFKLSQRTHDFAYRFMKLDFWRVTADLIVMRVVRDIMDGIGSVLDVMAAEKNIEGAEDECLRVLMRRELNVMFVQALSDVTFRLMAFGALLSTTAVTGHMLLSVGAVSVATSLVKNHVGGHREEYESQRAAEKVNALVDKGGLGSLLAV